MAHAKFHSLLCTYFNKSELRTLCFDLSINYENLPGDTLADKVRELIIFCHRYGQIAVLVNQCRELRPVVSWPNERELIASLEHAVKNDLYGFQKSDEQIAYNQTFHGDYNVVSSHGGQSTVNVTNIHQSPIEDAATKLKRGIELIHIRAYDQAIDALDSALKLNPDNSKIYFYLAIALLKGNRPKLLKLSTIKTIENHLRAAVELSPEFGQAYVFWALLKYDYYTLNSIREHPPTVTQLLSQRWSISREEVKELKSYLEAPRNQVWKWLQSV
jgi:tetratricopeptide (TPR) repeat protein